MGPPPLASRARAGLTAACNAAATPPLATIRRVVEAQRQPGGALDGAQGQAAVIAAMAKAKEAKKAAKETV